MNTMVSETIRQRLLDGGCPNPDDPKEVIKWYNEQKEFFNKQKKEMLDELDGIQAGIEESKEKIDVKNIVESLLAQGLDPVSWLIREVSVLAGMVQVERGRIAYLEGREIRMMQLLKPFLVQEDLDRLAELEKEQKDDSVSSRGDTKSS